MKGPRSESRAHRAGLGWRTPQTEGERARDAAKWIRRSCRTAGCPAIPCGGGYCAGHARTRPATMEPALPVEGRCNARLKASPMKRCTQVLRHGDARCPYHRGYVEPEGD